MTNEKIILQLKKGYDVKNPQLAQVLSNLEDKGVTEAELEKALEGKADLVDGKVPADQLPNDTGSNAVHLDFSLFGTTVSGDVAESIKTAECIIVDNLTGSNLPIIYTRSDFTNTRRWFCALRDVNTIATFNCNFNTNSLTQITLSTVSDFLLNSNSFINSLQLKLGLGEA